MDYIVTFFKAIGLFALGLFAFRIMGSQAVGRLTDFDLVVAIAIGSLIAIPLSDPNLNVWISVVGIVALVLTQITLSYLTLKSRLIETIVQGTPIKLIENGSILIRGLRRARISKTDLEEELRTKGYNTTTKVAEAYIEPNGKLSVIERK